MTREEVIKELKIEFIGEYDKQREAKNLAIKALEQEPVLDKIRAEIKQLPDMDETGVFSSVRMKSMVLDILDKYKESE